MKFRDIYPKTRYPFSDELCDFMCRNPEFYKSLKLSNEVRFKFFEPIILSHLPKSEGKKSKDEIIGMFYFDGKDRVFKQDYVVNIGCRNNEFVSYARSKNSTPDRSVRSIHEFYSTYGKNGEYYHKAGKLEYEHWYKEVNDLPNIKELRINAKNVLEKIYTID